MTTFDFSMRGVDLDYEEDNRAAHVTANEIGRYLVTLYNIVDGVRVVHFVGGQNQLDKATGAAEQWAWHGTEPRNLFAPPPEFVGGER